VDNPDNPMEDFAKAASWMLGLPLAAEHCPGVVLNLHRAAAMYTLIAEFPLPESVEAAPVFAP
jgi:hypothetical protein